KPIPAVEAGLLPWHLAIAISREAVLPGTGDSLVVAGGLTTSHRPSSSIFSLHTSGGSTAPLGTLAVGAYGGAVAPLASQNLLLGGATPAPVATIQDLSVSATGRIPGSTIGSLPEPRVGAAAVTIGPTLYVLGGLGSPASDSTVWSSLDGRHFAKVGTLPVPVSNAAAAVLNGKIYLFGGETTSPPGAGTLVDDIQSVDPTSGQTRILGHLPQPTAGAFVTVLSGNIYLAGGVTAAAGTAASVGAAQTSRDIWAFDPGDDRVLHAGALPTPLAFGATGVIGGRAWLIGGEVNGAPVSTVEMMEPNSRFGTAGAEGAGSPFYGAKLLVADRGNDRLVLLDTDNRVVWTYPSAYAAAPPGGFYFPDDAFFARGGSEIISNQENNETIVIIAFPSGQLLWQYGHPRQVGSTPGYLHTPDDAYLLKSGQVTIADAYNCRVLFINPNKAIAAQIGTTGVCQHQPPTDVGSPNGDTPLADGNVLISEINGSWVSEYTPTGHLVWTVQLPVNYPSDAQQLGPDLYLVSDYSKPGAILEFDREGHVLYKYSPSSGPGELDHPSLTELLPSGVFMTNDDYRDRMVAIDPATQALVWQYGVDDLAGTAPGWLNTPDGFDVLLPDGTTPTHPTTG
ncbi:MAG TPA: hypothetical protein VLX59_05905, partial [Acidimicrobiales bacterium]|nr:hypothetical protein [Acidimicrobiales bacterium]